MFHSHSIFYGNGSGFYLIQAVPQSLWYAGRTGDEGQASGSQQFHRPNNQKAL